MSQQPKISTHDNYNMVISQEQYDMLTPFAEKSLINLTEENQNFLVFPTETAKELEGKSLFNLSESIGFKINTYNMMGVFKIYDKTTNKSLPVEIRSRFDPASDCQPFLTHLLSKVFEAQFIDWKTDTKNGLWEFLLAILFSYYLNRALTQGMFKKYRSYEYNNSNFRGVINITEHIRYNIPFQGNIAYKTRENSFDNNIMHLVRHAISYIKSQYSYFHRALLSKNEYYISYQAVEQATPSWKIQESAKTMRSASKPLNHPYFMEYEPLRKLCLQILYKEGASVYSQKSTSQIEGVVFDGAWLWEKYIGSLLKPLGFKHHLYSEKGDGISVFQGDRYKLYPDFLNDEKKVVLDSKYKRSTGDGPNREDLHQVLSYMYLTQAKLGGLIFPDNKKTSQARKSIYGNNAQWINLHFHVPKFDNIENSRNSMIDAEEKFISDLDNFMKDDKFLNLYKKKAG